MFEYPIPASARTSAEALSAQDNFAGPALISHAAIARNLAHLRQCAPEVKQMAIVKADAYGHGLVEVAYTALRCGVEYLGAAQLAEALSLREGLDRAGIPREEARIFTWIAHDTVNWEDALRADLELSVSTPARLMEICTAVGHLREENPDTPPARIHLKIDSGMGRAGARLETSA